MADLLVLLAIVGVVCFFFLRFERNQAVATARRQAEYDLRRFHIVRIDAKVPLLDVTGPLDTDVWDPVLHLVGEALVQSHEPGAIMWERKTVRHHPNGRATVRFGAKTIPKEKPCR